MVQRNKLFDEHLEHIGEALQKSHRTYAVRTEAALECGTNLTLKIDIKECQKRVCQKKRNSNQHAFGGNGEPLRHERAEEAVNPICK